MGVTVDIDWTFSSQDCERSPLSWCDPEYIKTETKCSKWCKLASKSGRQKAWLSPVSKLAGLLEMMFKATHGGMGKVTPPSLHCPLPSAVHDPVTLLQVNVQKCKQALYASELLAHFEESTECQWLWKQVYPLAECNLGGIYLVLWNASMKKSKGSWIKYCVFYASWLFTNKIPSFTESRRNEASLWCKSCTDSQRFSSTGPQNYAVKTNMVLEL